MGVAVSYAEGGRHKFEIITDYKVHSTENSNNHPLMLYPVGYINQTLVASGGTSRTPPGLRPSENCGVDRVGNARPPVGTSAVTVLIFLST